ncbi:conserved barrel domain protein (plasmid) [Azospirillum sp. B510]|uniref:cupin domain-containing protein n=1 Tax=Azospirillum sp. (strain B510) TaxID=137722 RepID=UPI0001C4C9CC|nr:cupin domain-containing protein [Azospirillum sp. B510]BAI75231.1 conserved barrel domain protein [Azospirillum sp. B510]
MVNFMKSRQRSVETGHRQRSHAVLLAAGLLLAGSPVLADSTDAGAGKTPPAPRSTVLLQTTTHANGAPIVYPTGKPMVTVRVTEIPPGVDTGIHNHPIPLITYILEGELTIRGVSGVAYVYKPGDAFVETAEFHHGVNEGKEMVRLLAVYAGEVGAPLSIKPPQ